LASITPVAGVEEVRHGLGFHSPNSFAVVLPRWQHNAFSLHPCRRLKAALHPLYDLVDAEALGPLAGWKLLNVARNLATERMQQDC